MATRVEIGPFDLQSGMVHTETLFEAARRQVQDSSGLGIGGHDEMRSDQFAMGREAPHMKIVNIDHTGKPTKFSIDGGDIEM